MATFTAEHKEEMNLKPYFDFGVHKVQILGFKADETDDGKEFVEASFCDPENSEIEDTARLWFTTDKAIGYSFSTLRSIFVHNAPEDKKDSAKEAVNATKNQTELCELLNTKLKGKEMWYSKYPDQERTYLDNSGYKRPSVNRNIYGFPVKLKEELMPKKSQGNNLASVAKEVFQEDALPFETEGDKKAKKKDDWM